MIKLFLWRLLLARGWYYVSGENSYAGKFKARAFWNGMEWSDRVKALNFEPKLFVRRIK